MDAVELIAVIAGLAYAVAQIGLLTGIFFRLGSLTATVQHHAERIETLEAGRA